MSRRAVRRLIQQTKKFKNLGDSVKVAQLDACQEMTPFIHCKLTDRPSRIDGVRDYDQLTIARDLNARTAVASA
jgi:hypothetical protein